MKKIFTFAMAVLLLVLAVSGCVLRETTGISMPSVKPVMAVEYSDDPIGWLVQRVTEDTAYEKLSEAETEKLTSLVYLSLLASPFLQTQELSKWDILSPLFIYYQDAFYYDYTTGNYAILPDMTYAPEGFVHSQWSTHLKTPVENAAAFIYDVWGTQIPEPDEDFGDWDALLEDSIVCRDGVCYIAMSDYEHITLCLRAYQPLGDGVFYLSFDGDDSSLPGDPEKLKGNMRDYCRVLVKRSPSQWGFTILAKLKEGDTSLLPEDFPLPLYAK